jgi:hypothetical protein
MAGKAYKDMNQIELEAVMNPTDIDAIKVSVLRGMYDKKLRE